MQQALLPRLQRWSAGFRRGAFRVNVHRLTVMISRAAGSPEASGAVGTRRVSPSERRQQAGWAQRIAEKQSTELKRLDKMSDRLQKQLLDLDLDIDMPGEDGTSARVRSNSMASSSSSRRSRSRSTGRRPNGGIKGRLTKNTRGRRPRRTSFRPVPPSPEVLVALLRRTESKRTLLHQLNVRSPRAVASRLLLLSSLLDIPVDRLTAMSQKCGKLLLRRPEQLQTALTALADCLQALMPPPPPYSGGNLFGSGRPREGKAEQQQWQSGGSGGGDGGSSGGGVREEAEVLSREMAVAAPELLLVSPQRLRRSGQELGVVCKARGIKVLPMLSRRPDLLLQSAASLAAKMDLLPGLLGLPPKRLREVLLARPDLLRRSPRQLSRRYQLLGELCGVPPDFLAELIAQEPGVLGFGVDTMRAKFQTLAGQFGRFQDDVADMILVDPSVLIKAPPAAAAAAPPAAMKKKTAPAAPAPADVLPILDQLLQLSEASGIAVDAMLRLVVQDERVCSYSQEALLGHLAALAAALGLQGTEEARSRVGKHPELLLLAEEHLKDRVEALTRLLQPPRGAAASGGDVQLQGTDPVAAVTLLLQRHPELLLQDTADVHSRLANLSKLLLGTALAPPPSPPAMPAETGESTVAERSTPPMVAAPLLPPRLLALVTAQPSLLTAPPEETADKLLVMQSLFEIPRALALELISREPALLAVSADDLERKFRALAASFGAFSSDAIDVVFADPSLILRADTADPDSLLPPSPLLLRRSSPRQTTKQQQQQVKLGSGEVVGAAAATEVEAAARSGERRRRWQQQGGEGNQAAAADDLSSGVRQEKSDALEAKMVKRALQPQQLQDLAGEFLFGGAGLSLEMRGGGGSKGGGDSGGGNRGSGDMGLLGTMSAADFDKVGSEDLPPPPPPSTRRRRRLQQQQQPEQQT